MESASKTTKNGTSKSNRSHTLGNGMENDSDMQPNLIIINSRNRNGKNLFAKVSLGIAALLPAFIEMLNNKDGIETHRATVAHSVIGEKRAQWRE